MGPALRQDAVVTIRVIVLCCTLLHFAPLFPQANTDVIVMKNGDRFTCEIKGLSAGVLSVKLTYVDGTMAVQWSQVGVQLIHSIPRPDRSRSYRLEDRDRENRLLRTAD